VRESRRQVEDGRVLNQAFVVLMQKVNVQVDSIRQTITCGSTLVIDLDQLEVSYSICKPIPDESRLKKRAEFKESSELSSFAPAAETYFGKSNELFAGLHSETIH
jgi:hypothetical protein